MSVSLNIIWDRLWITVDSSCVAYDSNLNIWNKSNKSYNYTFKYTHYSYIMTIYSFSLLIQYHIISFHLISSTYLVSSSWCHTLLNLSSGTINMLSISIEFIWYHQYGFKLKIIYLVPSTCCQTQIIYIIIIIYSTGKFFTNIEFRNDLLLYKHGEPRQWIPSLLFLWGPPQGESLLDCKGGFIFCAFIGIRLNPGNELNWSEDFNRVSCM